MGYRKISNLYRSKNILLFRECFALEKIHGTSTNVSYNVAEDTVKYYSGGCNHESFLKVFDQEKVLNAFREDVADHPYEKITIYGEGYGGKMQKMSDTYGKELCFTAFEVKIGDAWLGVEQAHRWAERLGFEFVPYRRISTDEDAINHEMMRDSEIAVRRGMGEGKMREGVVLRSVLELMDANGGRIICKHKRPEFAEREHTPKFTDPDKLKIIEDAKAISDEWVTMMRLKQVLDKFENPDMKDTNKIIKAMIEDIYVEAKGEIVEGREVKKAIGKQTVKYFKKYLSEMI